VDCFRARAAEFEEIANSSRVLRFPEEKASTA